MFKKPAVNHACPKQAIQLLSGAVFCVLRLASFRDAKRETGMGAVIPQFMEIRQ